MHSENGIELNLTWPNYFGMELPFNNLQKSRAFIRVTWNLRAIYQNQNGHLPTDLIQLARSLKSDVINKQTDLPLSSAPISYWSRKKQFPPREKPRWCIYTEFYRNRSVRNFKNYVCHLSSIKLHAVINYGSSIFLSSSLFKKMLRHVNSSHKNQSWRK